MSGVCASQAVRRTVLALGLCLLAVGFAMEAKLALFDRSGGSESDIAAAKARPADLPEIEACGVPAPNPVHPKILFAFLGALTGAFSWTVDRLPGRKVVHNHRSVSSAAYFSPNLFFRPPPVR